jgi:Xaa-Pro aminopeptidase
MDLAAIQRALGERQLDGWLFYDFRGSDPLAYAVLGVDSAFRSRRWFYFIPTRGEPTRIVHAIETGSLDAVPGNKRVYLPWQQLHEHLRQTLAGAKRVAMQYSPMNNIPYVSRVDAGTIEMIRSFGVEVVSSADLIQQFEATIDEAGYQTHQRAALALGEIVHAAFAEIGKTLQAGKPPTECGIQEFIMQQFDRRGIETDHPPIVGVGPHSADPHFAPDAKTDTPIRRGDFVLIDLWGKEKTPKAIVADITWTAFVGSNPPADIVKVFEIVRDARDAAIRRVQTALAAGEPLRGCDVDDACRQVIVDAGHGADFIHRTGHSIHTMTHGNGTHIDNLETHDERPISPRTCFSIEPGIYLPGRFGVRSEIDMFVMDAKTAVVTGIPAQTQLVLIDA